MRAGGGKQKGAQFERDVCVLLSKWLTGGTSSSVFWRSAMSGGRATVAIKKNERHTSQAGDISCIDPVGFRFISSFAVECKFYSDLNFLGLLSSKGKLIDFWAEIKKQAELHKKEPMLFARQNRVPPFVGCASSGMALLGLAHGKATIINPPNDLYLVSADDFLAHCKPFV